MTQEQVSAIRKFAARYRLRVAMDECNDPVIKGRIGMSNIYEYSDSLLGVMFMTDGKKPPRTYLWGRFKRACLACGMTLRQDGDGEGSFTFDPDNDKQAKVAMRGIRVRVKKRISENHKAALRAGLFRSLASKQSVGAESTKIDPVDPKYHPKK